MRLYKLFLLSALMCLPVSAHAYEAVLVFSDCSETQKTELRAALNRTDEKLAVLIDKFNRNEVNDYVTAWFGTSKAVDVLQRYKKIRDMLDHQSTFVLNCQQRNCERDLFGFAEDNAISVCPDFFAAKLADGYDSMAGTLIHEFSHSYAQTVDNVYGTSEARRIAHAYPDKAINNADSYQYLFEAVTGDNVPYPTAGWSIENSCEWAYDKQCDQPGMGRGSGSCRPNTDAADCQGIPAPAATPIVKNIHRAASAVATPATPKPTYGEGDARNTCATAYNGTCDASCTGTSDYTDCLTGGATSAGK